MSARLLHAALLAELESAEMRIPPAEGIASIVINAEGAPSRDALVVMRHSTVVAHEKPLPRPERDRGEPLEVRPYQKLRGA